MDKGNIIGIFQGLEEDEVFLSSSMSPEDSNYNCIAWAYQLMADRWMWPPVDEEGNDFQPLDGYPWWPEGAKIGLDIECLVDVFEKRGFTICENWEHEERYVKVALYYDPNTGRMTHAARECRTKRAWMSKLGQGNDIYHKNPYTIEGNVYGKVYCIMKKEDK